ncbi:telomere-protecting terminal protein Tpg [Streptomyces sp. NPDC058622]|uniref:telomere-protecting terminal protein Tpg n=1 Tax=Streptomyces sp. NPDC058622 TaxID=3346562 RepID=UPI00365A0624
MGDIDDALEHAERDTFTRQPPKSLKARLNYLMSQLKSTKAIAQEIGVSQRSVERYRKGDRKTPPKEITSRIDAAVRSRWQPQVRERRRRHAATSTGLTVEMRARFGYTAPVGTTDDGRFRRLTVRLPPAYAQRLLDARGQGASDREMREIVAEALKDVYFQDGGARANDLTRVQITDLDYIDIAFGKDH